MSKTKESILVPEHDDFGLQMRIARKQHGLSQGQLAEMLNVSDSYISMLESNTRSPSRDMKYKLRVILSLGDYLFDSIIAINLRTQIRVYNRMEFYVRHDHRDGTYSYTHRIIEMTGREVEFTETYVRYESPFALDGHEQIPYTRIEFDAYTNLDIATILKESIVEHSKTGAANGETDTERA